MCRRWQPASKRNMQDITLVLQEISFLDVGVKHTAHAKEYLLYSLHSHGINAHYWTIPRKTLGSYACAPLTVVCRHFTRVGSVQEAQLLRSFCVGQQKMDYTRYDKARRRDNIHFRCT